MPGVDHQSDRRTCARLLCLTAILIAPTIFAGDEDMSPNAYNVFDPVTGYMVPADSQPNAQQGHEMSETDASSTTEPLESETEISNQLNRWFYVLAVVLLAGGFAAWRRNKDRISSNKSI